MGLVVLSRVDAKPGSGIDIVAVLPVIREDRDILKLLMLAVELSSVSDSELTADGLVEKVIIGNHGISEMETLVVLEETVADIKIGEVDVLPTPEEVLAVLDEYPFVLVMLEEDMVRSVVLWDTLLSHSQDEVVTEGQGA